MSIAYLPKSLADQIGGLNVRSIRISAHPPTALGSKTSQKTNYWVMYLEISDTGSLRLDPSPGSDGVLTLIVSRKAYLYSNNAVKTIRLSAVEHLTARNIIDYLYSSNYIDYRFHDGQGCRYWIDSAILLLSSTEYMTVASEVEEARDALKFVWGSHGKARKSAQSDIIAGTFYKLGNTAEASPAASSSAQAAEPYEVVVYGGGASAVDTSVAQPTTESGSFPIAYAFVQNRQYFWNNNGVITNLSKCPKNEWVYNEEGWKEMNRTRKWRKSDGRETLYT